MGLGDGANDTLMRIQRHMENFHRGHAHAANCVEEFLSLWQLVLTAMSVTRRLAK